MLSFSQHITEIEEGVNDPAIFKAIFLAGGPGSGKSFIVGKTGLTSLGFKVVNPDTAFEKALNKAGLEMNPDNIFSVKGQDIRGRAKELTNKQQELYVKGRLGLVIDGTGKDANKILRQRGLLQKLGYSTAMILVNTDKETALKRNDARPRRLDPKEVGKMWDEVQSNLGRYQQAFKKNFIIVDNSDGKDYNKETLRAYRLMSKFAKAEPMNPIAKKWIATQKEETNPRIPRKKGQPANSKKHSDLYTDENPRGTIHGLGFKDVETARASIKKIENSGRKHAHKIQAAVAMEQRAREMGKTAEAAIYRTYINKMKKKTKEMNKSEDTGGIGFQAKGYMEYHPKNNKKFRKLTPFQTESYKSLFLPEQKNTHMTHIEDKVLYGGVKGTREAINALRSIRDMLAGKSSTQMSVKWDGAPAIFCGEDPTDGKFFVAKKGIFAKSGAKVYKSNADIDADNSGDLAEKLKLAFKHLKNLGIKDVIQGDFLYSKQDLNKTKIDGKQYITFHPNTIVYAVEAGTEAAKRITKSQIGVVWHTTYKGKDFASMKASYGVKKIPSSPAVWSQDAELSGAGEATMNEKETKEVTSYLSTAGFLFNKVAGDTLRELEKNPKLAQLIEQYNNTFVRAGQMLPDSKKHTARLIRWIENKYKKEIDKRKTAKGKQAQQDKLDSILKFFSPQNKVSLVNMFDLQKNIVLAKLKLINRLNSISNIDAFVKTSKGYKTTGAEGYVAIDKLGGGAVKLVDRLEFSYNNFSPDILKGWDKPR